MSMKKYRKLTGLICTVLVMLCALLYQPMPVMAETEEKDFIEQESAGDFAVMFTYEGEKPDIVLISPSGKEYVEGTTPETELVTAHGDGWSSYKVIGGEAGQWEIRFDRKDNAEIKYSLIDEVDGICIQSFEIVQINGTKANVRFEVTKGENEVVGYKYEISAIAGDDETARKNLTSGHADSGQVVELEIDMNLSSYEDYRLLLNVTCTDGLEMFDSMTTESFSFENPNTPAAIKDFWTYIYGDENLCKLDWEEFNQGYSVEYNVVVLADGDKDNPIYTGTVSETNASFYYPEDAKEINITLYYKQDGVLSKAKSKDIAVDGGEYLSVATDDVTGDSQVKLQYKAGGSTELSVKLNEEEGTYNIKGEDEVMFALEPGVNNIAASFEGDDRVIYAVSQEIYYSSVTPEITLYEELNGRNFTDDVAVIYGKIKNASKLYINDVELTVDDNGEFMYEYELEDGSNQVVVKATSDTGVSTAKSMTLTKISSGIVSDSGSIVPTIIIVVAVVIIIVCSVIFIGMKKKTDQPKQPADKKQLLKKLLYIGTGVSGVLEAVLIFLFVRLHIFNRSGEYVELVEESMGKAASYLTYETVSLVLMIIMAVLFVGLLATSILLKVLRKKDK